MNKWKTFIGKLYLQRKKAILSIFGIMLFVSGYLFSVNTLFKPTSDSQFEFYEQIAHDVYEQGNVAIYEFPDGVTVEISATCINVFSDDWRYHGKVIASLENGELVYKRESAILLEIFVGLLVGCIFVCIGALVWVLVDEKVEKRIASECKRENV